MKCEDYSTYSVLCQCCDFPKDIKCKKEVHSIKPIEQEKQHDKRSQKITEK